MLFTLGPEFSKEYLDLVLTELSVRLAAMRLCIQLLIGAKDCSEMPYMLQPPAPQLILYV